MPATRGWTCSASAGCSRSASRASRSRTGRYAATPEIRHLTRPAAGKPEGALVLLHGRGADEHDLFPLLDELDPDRRLVGVTPRGPLSLPPGGAHWYAFYRVGFPDPQTFQETWTALTRWLDALPEATGVGLDRTVIGGFSQGTAMTYALGLGEGRPRAAALIALSGFMPTVDGLELDLASAPPVAIGHGTFDEVIPVEFGRDARRRLEEAGVEPLYREYPYPHAVDPRFLVELRPWIAAALTQAAA